MIEVYNQVPRVYYKESRDFQLLGRLYESILNYNKMNIDSILNVTDPKNIDDKLVNLLSKTIGFESKHEYDVNNLKIICGCFSEILKYKGSKLGVDMAVSALLNSQGIDDSFTSTLDTDNRIVQVYIPSNTKDLILLKDLFEYILPVGWTYTISEGYGGQGLVYTTETKINNEIVTQDKLYSELNKVAKLNGGESGEEVENTSSHVVSQDTRNY